ncbi:DoxX family protein [Deinococcus aquaticus]|uniref:DoxX family protein n=1 Tax=Deinococcus aquaticus TaxID=328692 RepID=UPI003F45B841
MTRTVDPPTTLPRTLARVLLGSFMMFAGVGHMTFLRRDFQAQVPTWLPLDKDFVVLASGVVEVGFGAALLALPRQRQTVGWVLAAFFVAIFPGNVSQYLTHQSAFGLDTDGKRLGRLFFQPVLVALALWSTGAWPRRRR